MTNISIDKPTPIAPALRSTRRGLLLGLVLTGQFMAVLDVSIVNVAAPTVRADLHASGAGLQLVIAGYTIAYAVLLITGARLGERLGYSRVFQAGLATFTLASLACGLAPTTSSLIGFRLVQGAGAAMMVPQVISLIQRSFTGAARVRALGAYTAVLAGGMVVGQVLGGVLVTADLFGAGWRPAFLVNVPIGAVLLVAGWSLLPSHVGNRERSLDVAGLVTLSSAVFLLVVPLVLGHEEHWPVWGWLMMATSLLLAGVFATTQRRIADRGGSPLIHTRIVRTPGLPASAGAIFLIMAGFSGFLFAFALHLQSGLGESALRSGLTFAPMALGFGLAGLYWRRLPQRLHPGLPLPSLAACVAGYAALGLAMRGGGPVGVDLEVLLLVMGAFAGCAYGPLFAAALSRVEPRDAADASGVMVTVIQLGQVVGVATFGTLFLTALTGPLGAHSSGHAVELTTLGVAVATAGAAIAAWRQRRSTEL